MMMIILIIMIIIKIIIVIIITIIMIIIITIMIITLIIIIMITILIIKPKKFTINIYQYLNSYISTGNIFLLETKSDSLTRIDLISTVHQTHIYTTRLRLRD